ncbi:hypothetical protein EDC01DRAFT_439748 [Geopyxis carbonaria]|nr:hypothetical protein EDC01DRAFT_439748 [Geopyxis carbonaria]
MICHALGVEHWWNPNRGCSVVLCMCFFFRQFYFVFVFLHLNCTAYMRLYAVHCSYQPKKPPSLLQLEIDQLTLHESKPAQIQPRPPVGELLLHVKREGIPPHSHSSPLCGLLPASRDRAISKSTRTGSLLRVHESVFWIRVGPYQPRLTIPLEHQVQPCPPQRWPTPFGCRLSVRETPQKYFRSA